MNVSQQELIARSIRGDSQAYAMLLGELEPMLRRVIGARLRGRSDVSADEVLQDVRIYLLQRLDRYNPAYPLGVFARGLLKRVATRMYFPDEEAANAEDPVLLGLEPEERATLVARAEDGTLRFDVVLQGPRQTTFFAV